MLIYLVNLSIANIFGLGGNPYAEGSVDIPFEMGNIFTSGLNSMTYALILIPWMNYISIKKYQKYLISILGIVITISLVLAAKRISITGVVLGYLFLLLFQKKRSKNVKYVIIFLIAAVFTFPIYSNILLKQIELREGRLDLDNLEQEGRYAETFIVLDEVFSFDDLTHSFLGKEMFNSPTNYGDGIFGRRQLHSDYNVILHGSGIFGLILFLYTYYIIIRHFLRLKKRLRSLAIYNKYMRYLDPIFISFILVSLWLSFAGGISGVVYNALKNAVLGGIIGYYTNICLRNNQGKLLSPK
jgi:O-antigen ligase